MTTIRCNDNWVQFNSHETQYFLQNDNNNQEHEEETLSLCDLPINNQETEPVSKTHENETEDFEFGSCHAQKNMCNADEVFFQGQMLPLRHSVSYESSGSLTRKINRSISINDPRTIRYKPKIRNQFHSHPSPSPQIRTQTFRAAASHLNPRTSSLWSYLQVSLVKPQEIGLSDLKNRSKRFGSHNSNSSTSSSMNSTNDQNQIENKKKKKKKKQKMFLTGGCKCSADSIEHTITDQTVPKKKTTKVENMLDMSNESTMMFIGEGKQTVSRHRTFEWLKQLSLVSVQNED